MNLRNRATRGLARQLGHPSGLAGRVVARVLNRRNHAAVRAATAVFPVRPGDVLVDVGFGGGLGLELLLRAVEDVGGEGQVHGVDVSRTMVEAARRRFRREISAGRLALHEATMENLPFDDGAAQAVMTLNTIYFVPDLVAALTELGRVTDPGGRVVVGLGDPGAMARMAVTREGFRLRPLAEVIEALHAAGLRLLEEQRVGRGEGAFHLLVAEPAAPGR